MRRFVIGSVIGALLMYAFIHYGPAWKTSGSRMIGDTASEYRGDRHRRAADEVLR